MKAARDDRPPLRILIVDDEEVIHRGLAPYLKDLGHQVDDAYRGDKALEMIEAKDYDLVLADVQMPKMDGLTLLEKAGEIDPEVSVVIVTAHGDMDMVIKALRLGAADFINKPVKLQELDGVIEKSRRLRDYRRRERRIRSALEGVQKSAYGWRDEGRLVGRSGAMDHVRELIRAAAEVDCETVLIQGETGAGKEVVAREVHLSGRKEGSPFIAVSCPALPDNLIESELFGHVKGSFTGADADKAGCFEMADGGTLFLDEIADLSEAAQAKLLRVLETRSVRRIGGKKEVSVNVNLVAATNAPLRKLVSEKSFREDLYYRLNVFTIDVPPLRERKVDIKLLAEHFLGSYCRGKGLPIEGISEAAMARLEDYDFPGNARELRNMIERAAILAREGMIETRHLSLGGESSAEDSRVPSSEESEKKRIVEILERNKWNRSRAAEDLGVSYAALRYRMKKYDISL